jgi:hypothetical protein
MKKIAMRRVVFRLNLERIPPIYCLCGYLAVF